MDKKLDKQQALRAYAKIAEYCEQTNSGHYLLGVHAESDFDGYSLTLRDKHVTLNLHFHNTYAFEFECTKKLDTFIDKIQRIDKTQHTKIQVV